MTRCTLPCRITCRPLSFFLIQKRNGCWPQSFTNRIFRKGQQRWQRVWTISKENSELHEAKQDRGIVASAATEQGRSSKRLPENQQLLQRLIIAGGELGEEIAMPQRSFMPAMLQKAPGRQSTK